eukprot:4908391-Pyramimonas_sp.AAC.1
MSLEEDVPDIPARTSVPSRADVIHAICDFAKPGLTLDCTDDRRLAQKVCEFSKDFLRQSVCSLIRKQCPSRVLTRFISSDETPLLLNTRFSKVLAGLRRIV